MEYIDYVIWKALAMVVLAFFWGVFCGITGRSLKGERLDSQAKAPGQTVQRND